ncbi:hypothetical protein [Massilia rubra]|uniref:Uncharacterized protein n=1 Tax=Massilia rubra TaxID=2607910 RepID=A0ABX0LR67_9BURK|nr:hypothetical protein [Massilia rubra]NHZ35335.1 hypothetical protein [Massilia rubra]
MLRAVVHVAAVMVACRGDEPPAKIELHSIPTLPLSACQMLANVGHAAWRHLDGHESTKISMGELWRFKRFELHEEDAAIETAIGDCRVTGYDVHALADAYLVDRETEKRPAADISTSSAVQDKRETVANNDELCALSEDVHNGGALDWAYWVARKTITPMEAAKLTYCIDPIEWPGNGDAQGSFTAELQKKIVKCAALLGDIQIDWSLPALCAYLGIEDAPYRMRIAAQSEQDRLAKFAQAPVPPRRSITPPPPPPTRLDTSRGPVVGPIKYEITLPDWTRWSRLDIVRLWEASCLLADIEPPLADGAVIWAEYQTVGLSPAFHEAWEIINADSTFSKLEILPYSGRMLWNVDLAGFADWAIGKGFNVPAGLRMIAARRSVKLAVGRAPEAGTQAPQPAPLTHKLRINSLDAPIDKAIGLAGSHKTAAVFLELRALALNEEKPFTGIIEGDSLCYTTDDGRPDGLTKNALEHRLRQRRRASGRSG